MTQTIEHIRTGAKAFIVHEGKILVIQERVQRNGKEVIIHDVPGGGLEAGETAHEALIREVWEEVGLKVEIERPVGAWDFIVNHGEKRTLIVCLGYQCRLVGKTEIDVTNNPAAEDIFNAMWLTKEEILEGKLFEDKDRWQSLENVRT